MARPGTEPRGTRGIVAAPPRRVPTTRAPTAAAVVTVPSVVTPEIEQNYIQLPDGQWMDRKAVEQLQKSHPTLYTALTSKGYDAYVKAHESFVAQEQRVQREIAEQRIEGLPQMEPEIVDVMGIKSIIIDGKPHPYDEIMGVPSIIVDGKPIPLASVVTPTLEGLTIPMVTTHRWEDVPGRPGQKVRREVKVSRLDLARYSQLKGKEQFKAASKLGLIPKDTVYVAGEKPGTWGYIPKERQKVIDALKDYKVDGGYALTTAIDEGKLEAVRAAQKAGFFSTTVVTGARKFVREVVDFKAKHTQLPAAPDDPNGQWIDNKQLNEIRSESPEVYSALMRGGFAEATKLYAQNQAAITKLDKYTTDEGTDGSRYLRDNPGDTQTLIAAGFTEEQIEPWQEYNGLPYVRSNPFEQFNREVVKRGGTPLVYAEPKEVQKWNAFLNKNPDLKTKYFKVVQQIADPDRKIVKTDTSLVAFQLNYLAARGFEEAPKTKEDRRDYNVLKAEAEAEYTRIYGSGTMLSSRGTELVSLVFAPARVAHPEVVFRDIGGLEWGIGVAQVALIAVPLIGKGIGAVVSPALAKATTTGIIAGSGGVFTADTVTHWNAMSSVEKAVAGAIDFAILASALTGIAPSLTRKLRMLTSRTIKTTAKVTSRVKTPKTWTQAHAEALGKMKEISKAEARMKALDKRIAQFEKPKPKSVSQQTWAQRRNAVMSEKAKLAKELANKEAGLKYIEKRLAQVRQEKMVKVTKAESLRRAATRTKKALSEKKALAKEMTKHDTRMKALDKAIADAQQAKKTASTWIQARLKAISKAKAELKAAEKLEERMKALNKAIAKAKREKQTAMTWAQKRARTIAESSARSRAVKLANTKLKALDKQLIKLKEARLKVERNKKSWLQLLNESNAKRKIIATQTAKMKALDKASKQATKAKLKAQAKETRRLKLIDKQAADIIRKSREATFANINRMLKDAKKGVQPGLEAEVKAALDNIADGIAKSDIKLLTAGAKRLEIVGARVPKQLGGGLLQQKARLLLANPKQFLRLTKGKLSPAQITEIEKGLEANKGFIDNAERSLRKVKDPTRKLDIEKALQEAKRQVKVATKIKLQPLVRFDRLTTDPVKFPLVKTEVGIKAVTTRVPKAKTRITVTTATRTFTVPVSVFRRKSLSEVATQYRVKEDDVVWAVAMASIATQTAIQIEINERIREIVRSQEGAKVVPYPQIQEKIKALELTELSPYPEIEPKPVPEPEPRPEPQPVPVPPPKPGLERVKPIPPPPRLRSIAASPAGVIIPDGSIAWAQGSLASGRGKSRVVRPVWKYIPPPWDQNKPITLMSPPRGALNSGSLSSYATIQVIGRSRTARVPREIEIDLGWADVKIVNGRAIYFRSGGQWTDVGGRILGPTKGMSVEDGGIDFDRVSGAPASQGAIVDRTKMSKKRPSRTGTRTTNTRPLGGIR